MRHRVAACFCASLPFALAAQGPTFVPRSDALFVARFDDVPAIAAALPKTRLGRLLAQADVAAAWTTGAGRQRAESARTALLLAKAVDLKVEVDPWNTANHADRLLWSAWAPIEWQDVRDVAFVAVSGRGDDANALPRSATVIRLHPRVEGKATQRFDAAAHDVERSEWLVPTADAKFGGVPARVFEPKPPTGEQLPYRMLGAWLVHLPGTFAFGTGAPDDCGAVGEEPVAAAGMSMQLDLQGYAGLFGGGAGAGAADAAKALGLGAPLRWHVTFNGDAVRDELTLVGTAKPCGVFGCLSAGTAPLVRQALPKGAILQVRLAVDVPMLLEAMVPLTGGNLPLTREETTAMARVLTGGIALGVAAPAPGGFVPRLFVTLGVSDEAAARALLAKLLGAHGKEVTHDGVAMSMVTVPGMPVVLQPTFCVHDGALLVAESVASMRALLAAARAGGDAMAIGDVPPPAEGAAVVPGFDLRWDAAALYRAFHATWLPLFEMTAGREPDSSAPIVTRDDLPEPDVVAEHLGCGRGVLLRDGTSLTLRQQGALGGIELAAFAMAWAPLVLRLPGRNITERDLAQAIGHRQLDAVWPALQKFHDQHGRWPKDLAELFAAGKLPPDALLLPGDDLAEPIATGDAAAGADAPRSSFRYFPGGVAFDANGAKQQALLVEIRPRRFNRLALTVDGVIPDVFFGEDSRKPIDAFGK